MLRVQVSPLLYYEQRENILKHNLIYQNMHIHEYQLFI